MILGRMCQSSPSASSRGSIIHLPREVMPRAQVMHATARRGSLLRDSMMSAKAGPKKATVCKVLRTRVTLQPDLISLSASRPTHNDKQHAAPGSLSKVTLLNCWQLYRKQDVLLGSLIIKQDRLKRVLPVSVTSAACCSTHRACRPQTTTHLCRARQTVNFILFCLLL